jgi:PAT family acetyl-CoA transporter-like MFS transporter 1
VKLLWAPIVDSVYIKAFGRRKTWICSSQMLIGMFMIFLSHNVDEWLGDGEKGHKPQIVILTTVFFMLWFLTSVQGNEFNSIKI